MTASVDIEAHGIRAPAADPCSDKQLASRPRSDAGASASAMVPQHTSRLRSSAEENREKMLAAAFSWTMLRRLARRLSLRTPLGRTQAEHQRVLARLKPTAAKTSGRGHNARDSQLRSASAIRVHRHT